MSKNHPTARTVISLLLLVLDFVYFVLFFLFVFLSLEEGDPQCFLGEINRVLSILRLFCHITLTPPEIVGYDCVT